MRSETPLLDAYVDRLVRDFRPGRPLCVVWDAGNGATGEALRAMTARLPGRHELLFADIDGRFPNHHPDPTIPENLDDLIAAVRNGGADLGIAFDGDGDRIGVVDGQGRIMFGDQLMQILAADVLARHPGSPILADVKASQALFDEIERLGGQAVMGKTGHSLMKTAMAEMGAPLAGEMSGHIFYADGFYGYDDALYVAIRLLGILGQSDLSLAERRDRMAPMVNTPELRFDCPDEQKFAVIERVKAGLAAEGARGQRDRRGARQHGRRLVAAARVEHAGGAGRARRGQGPGRARAPEAAARPRICAPQASSRRRPDSRLLLSP